MKREMNQILTASINSSTCSYIDFSANDVWYNFDFHFMRSLRVFWQNSSIQLVLVIYNGFGCGRGSTYTVSFSVSMSSHDESCQKKSTLNSKNTWKIYIYIEMFKRFHRMIHIFHQMWMLGQREYHQFWSIDLFDAATTTGWLLLYDPFVAMKISTIISVQLKFLEHPI